MSPARMMVRAAARWNEAARARATLRGAHVGRNVRVFGRPSVVCEGDLVVGDGAIIVSTPAAVTLVVESGASLEIGAGAYIESGVTLRACRRVVVSPGAHVAAGAVVDDVATVESELVVHAHDPKRPVARPHPVARVRAAIASVVPSVADLGPADDVRHAQGWDSLAALRVVVALEATLGVDVPHDLFTRVTTLDGVASALRETEER